MTTAAGARVKAASSSSRLYAPKQRGESDEVFFFRAAKELGQRTRGRAWTAEEREALERLARGAAYNTIRFIVRNGGVVGSAKATGYAEVYRSGYTTNNFVGTDPSNPKPTDPIVGLREDPGLERDVRELLAKAPTGREALEQLAGLGATIRFRNGGGTVFDPDTKTMVVDTLDTDGKPKPLSWMVLSIAHESAHEWQHAVKALPEWLSPLAEKYRLLKAKMQVSRSLREAVLKERKHYVNRMVWSEAHAMTREARVRRELEAQGVDFLGADFLLLNTTLIDIYNHNYENVYRAAGLKPPVSDATAGE
jgi:hypothetical protein